MAWGMAHGQPLLWWGLDQEAKAVALASLLADQLDAEEVRKRQKRSKNSFKAPGPIDDLLGMRGVEVVR